MFTTFVPRKNAAMEERYINIHTHRPQPGEQYLSTWMLGMNGQAPDPPYAAGIHPWNFVGMSDAEVEEALNLLQKIPNPVAVGEIGLDYAQAKEKETRGRQQTFFAAQLDIAAGRSLPVIVHCVRALEDTLRIMREHPMRNAIFHGFTGTPEQAARITGAGYFLSFGERTFRSRKTAEALRSILLDRLFLETDESFLPIEEIYRQAAEILNISISDLKTQIAKNHQLIFG